MDTLLVVPPVSKAIRFSKPAREPQYPAKPTAPETGEEWNVRAGKRMASSIPTTPPVPVVMRSESSKFQSDFSAYAIKLDEDHDQYTISLVDGQGKALPQSERMVVRLRSSLPLTAWLPVLIPILIGVYLRVQRKSKLSKTKQVIKKSNQ